MGRRRCCKCRRQFWTKPFDQDEIRCDYCNKIWQRRDKEESAREQKKALQAIRDDWDAEDAENERLQRMSNTKLTPELLAMAETLGKIINDSLIINDCIEEQGVLIALECLQKDITLFEFAEMYDIVSNKRCKKSARMLAEFKLAPHCSYEFTQRDGDGATLVLTEGRKDKDGKQIFHTFDCLWADVKDEPFTKKKGGETKANYATPRKRMQMLSARVVSDAIRTIAPEINAGLYTPEEIQDLSDDVETTGPKLADFVEVKKEEVIKSLDKAIEAEEIDPAMLAKLKAEEELHREILKEERIANLEKENSLPDAGNAIDLSICPAGKPVGTKWSDMDLAKLKAALKNTGEGMKVPEAYRESIEAEIKVKS